jgi:MYXO-CTERM domain-containing protein
VYDYGFVPLVPILAAGGATAAVRALVPPKEITARIAWFHAKARAEWAAYRRAKALRLHRVAAEHARRAKGYEREAQRLARRYTARRPIARPRVAVFKPAVPPPRSLLAPAPVPVGPPAFAPPPPVIVRPAAPPPTFVPSIPGDAPGKAEAAPAEMEPSTPEGGSKLPLWLGLGALGLGALFLLRKKGKGAKGASFTVKRKGAAA